MVQKHLCRIVVRLLTTVKCDSLDSCSLAQIVQRSSILIEALRRKIQTSLDRSALEIIAPNVDEKELWR